MQKKFTVSIHDVAPEFMSEVRAIIAKVQPLVGNLFSVAVIPQPWVALPLSQQIDWAGEIATQADEILLHGFSHQRQSSRHPFSVLVKQSDEFRGLENESAISKLNEGRRLLTQRFQRTIKGFAPPAWCAGPVNASILQQTKLKFTTNYFTLDSIEQRFPMATYSWDCGKFSWLGYVGELSGRLTSLRRSAIPQIVFHPADVCRGFVRFGIRRIKKLIAGGSQPVLYEDVI